MTPMNNRRVVITGCGAVTPIGIGKEAFWNALERGENGADFITLFDTAQHTTKIAAEVKDFNPENWLDKKRFAVQTVSFISRRRRQTWRWKIQDLT